jgi:uncharacterized Zn finger protein (UPF0148 family)
MQFICPACKAAVLRLKEGRLTCPGCDHVVLELGKKESK